MQTQFFAEFALSARTISRLKKNDREHCVISLRVRMQVHGPLRRSPRSFDLALRQLHIRQLHPPTVISRVEGECLLDQRFRLRPLMVSSHQLTVVISRGSGGRIALEYAPEQ